jgi:hypothetical protein
VVAGLFFQVRIILHHVFCRQVNQSPCPKCPSPLPLPSPHQCPLKSYLPHGTPLPVLQEHPRQVRYFISNTVYDVSHLRFPDAQEPISWFADPRIHKTSVKVTFVGKEWKDGAYSGDSGYTIPQFSTATHTDVKSLMRKSIYHTNVPASSLEPIHPSRPGPDVVLVLSGEHIGKPLLASACDNECNFTLTTVDEPRTVVCTEKQRNLIKVHKQ